MTPYEVSSQTKGLNSEEIKAFQLPNHPDAFPLEELTHFQQKQAFKLKLEQSARLSDILKIYLVELNKKHPHVDPQALECLRFLTWGHECSKLYKEKKEDDMNQPQPIDLPKEWRANPWIQECLSRMERFSNDPLKVEEYKEAEKALLIYTTDLEWKHRAGVAEGMEIGRKQGVEQGIKQGIKQGVEQGSRVPSAFHLSDRAPTSR